MVKLVHKGSPVVQWDTREEATSPGNDTCKTVPSHSSDHHSLHHSTLSTQCAAHPSLHSTRQLEVLCLVEIQGAEFDYFPPFSTCLVLYQGVWASGPTTSPHLYRGLGLFHSLEIVFLKNPPPGRKATPRPSVRCFSHGPRAL